MIEKFDGLMMNLRQNLRIILFAQVGKESKANKEKSQRHHIPCTSDRAYVGFFERMV